MTTQVQDQLGVAEKAVLIDRFGREHRSLRISVTDVCNIRCQYCMPSEEVRFLPRDSQLSFKQLADFVAVAATLGINKVRLTGGEPLMRPRLWELVELLSAIPAIDDVGLTTNAIFLADQLPHMIKAGLRRVNISLDTLSNATFRRLSRRDGLHRVLTGIEASLACPELTVRLNSLVLRDVNYDDVLELVAFAVARKVTLRFIEFMPLDASRAWSYQRMVRGDELREIIASKYGPLSKIESNGASQPSVDYQLGGGARVGFIDTVSEPFCERCDRLRLTCDGKIRNCLFGREEWDVRSLLKEPLDLSAIKTVLQQAVYAKHVAHGIANPDFTPPVRAMYQIGG